MPADPTAAREAIIRSVAATHGVDNPNTAPGSWWEHKAGPVLDLLLAPAPQREALDAERLREALGLMNSLGIAGPNIYHRAETDEDRADPKCDPEQRDLDAILDGEWCVCGRVWPCEALRLDTVIRAALGSDL